MFVPLWLSLKYSIEHLVVRMRPVDRIVLQVTLLPQLFD